MAAIGTVDHAGERWHFTHWGLPPASITDFLHRIVHFWLNDGFMHSFRNGPLGRVIFAPLLGFLRSAGLFAFRIVLIHRSHLQSVRGIALCLTLPNGDERGGLTKLFEKISAPKRKNPADTGQQDTE